MIWEDVVSPPTGDAASLPTGDVVVAIMAGVFSVTTRRVVLVIIRLVVVRRARTPDPEGYHD